MLGAIPFKVNGVLCVFIFSSPVSLSNSHYRNSLERLDSPNTVYLHMTMCMPSTLQHSMIRGIAHIGFGDGHEFVRDTPRGPQVESLPPSNSPSDSNYLATIVEALSQHLLLWCAEKRSVSEHLSRVIEALIRYASGLGNHAVEHLSTKEQSYTEFMTLSDAALCTRQEQCLRDGCCEGGNCCSLPVHIFETAAAFATWLKYQALDDEQILTHDQNDCDCTCEGASPL